MQGAPNIEAQSISEFPSDAELSNVDDTTIIALEGQDIDIRGTDRDRNSTGWGAIIIGDDRFPKRLQMDLYPTVDRETLAGHQIVTANLVVECERKADTNLRSKRIHLLSF